MPDRLTYAYDPEDPAGRDPRPALLDLRVLERSLVGRIARLDRRVDHLLDFRGIPTLEQVGEVDVLCAAIAEQKELLDEARAEMATHVERRRRRREHPRRWA